MNKTGKLDCHGGSGSARSELWLDQIPGDLAAAAADPLPRMRKVEGPWLTVDACYAAQVSEKISILQEHGDDVLRPPAPAAATALHAALCRALDEHPAFDLRSDGLIGCPDERAVPLRSGTVLQDAAAILQEDLCLIERKADGHILSAALLGFPASWTLAEKIGFPLGRIHAPVLEYESEIARRVDRLFDGVRAGQPMWRANLLSYSDPALYQPKREDSAPKPTDVARPFLRAERQTVLRLAPGLVLFAIHTSVARRETDHAAATGLPGQPARDANI